MRVFIYIMLILALLIIVVECIYSKVDSRTIKNLKGVHSDLTKVILHAYRYCDTKFIVTEGLRTVERQRRLVDIGASYTMNSKHLTGRAVDIAALDTDGKVTWQWDAYTEVYHCVRGAADLLEVDIIAGYEWEKLRDGVHYELLPK